jgi:hypothetical protein
MKNGCIHQLSLESKQMRPSVRQNPVDKKKIEKNAQKFQQFFESSFPVSGIKPHTVIYWLISFIQLK